MQTQSEHTKLFAPKTKHKRADRSESNNNKKIAASFQKTGDSIWVSPLEKKE